LWSQLGPWVLFAGGALLLGYVLIGYPTLLAALARLRPRPLQPDPDAPLPTVSVLISAYCEERDLPAKLASLASVDYPISQVEILIADDGSSDGTAAVVAEAAARDPRIRLLPATRNLGKPAQLNRLAEAATGEVLIFTDARQPLEPDALREVVAPLADPRVGGVSGAVAYRTPAGEAVPIGAYWKYESALRRWEGMVHSCCGAAGPLMALRRELWQPLPPQIVLDDMLTPLRLVMSGRRFVYAERAVAVETYAMNRRHEYQRRVRTLAGNYQLLRLEPALLLPWRNPIWWQFVSHKVLRLTMPWCLLAMLAGSLLGLGQQPFFAWALGVQGLFYLYALIGALTAGHPKAPKGSSAAYSLVLLAAASLAGLVRDLRGGSRGSWGAAERHRRE